MMTAFRGVFFDAHIKSVWRSFSSEKQNRNIKNLQYLNMSCRTESVLAASHFWRLQLVLEQSSVLRHAGSCLNYFSPTRDVDILVRYEEGKE